MHQRFITIALTVCSCVLLVAVRSQADPLPGETLKFIQMPLNGGLPVPVALPSGAVSGTPAPFPGHDEASTAYVSASAPTVFNGPFMADDFADKLSTPVVHVQWWGSYMGQSTPGSVQEFLISFESDVPKSPTGGFSQPGSPLLNQIVTRVPVLTPGSGKFTEKSVPVPASNPDGNMFQYNAELAVPFQERANTVYWLKIVALDPIHNASTQPGALQWGWHNRDWGLMDNLASPVPIPGEFNEAPAGFGPVWHFQDDAISGSVTITVPTTGGLPGVVQDPATFTPTNYIPGVDISPNLPSLLSKDLAFALYTVPEPSTFVLLGMGTLGLALARRRCRHRE